MRFALCTYAYAWAIGVPGYPVPAPMTPRAFLERAAALGAEAVQIADNMPLHAVSARERSELRAHAASLGLGIEVGARGLTAVNLDRYLDIAAEMGSPVLRMVIDARGYEPDMDAVHALVHPFLPRLAGEGIRLAIENHDRFRVQDYVALLERLDSGCVGICLDTANSLGAGQGIETVLDALAPWTVNLHVKDFTIRRAGHQMGFTVSGTPAGEGMLPLPDLLHRISLYGQCQSAVLESWPAPEASVEATIAKEDAWAQAGARYLHGALQRNLQIHSQQ